MSDLMKRLLKSGSAESSILSQSRFFTDDTFIDTGYPMLNLALSGKVRNGGFSKGLTMFAGPSKNFKSNYLLICMAAFQREHPDGVILYYDTEGGSKPQMFAAYGIDASRIIIITPKHLENMTHDIMQKTEDFTVDDNVMIAVDSFGNIPSRKELEDAISGKEVADMSRAKAMKSLGRMLTLTANRLNIPVVGINHTYETIEMFSKQKMGGGTGLMYSSDTVLFVGKRQEKDGKELMGYNFDLSPNKSRFVREGLKFPMKVTYEDGVYKYSGLFDLMLELTSKVEQFGAWYLEEGKTTKVRRSDLEDNEEFMEALLADDEFIEALEKKYRLPIAGKKVTFDDELEDKIDEADLENQETLNIQRDLEDAEFENNSETE